LPKEFGSYLVRRKDLLGVEHYNVISYLKPCLECEPAWIDKYPEL